ncbi:MAG: hypothetical protein AAFX00_01315 [Pseudomonadota bacterium]
MKKVMRKFSRRLWRDRRRHAICAALLFAAGTTVFHGNPELFGVPFWLVAGCAFVLGSLPCLVRLCLASPNGRHACEVSAVTLFLQALVSGLFSAPPTEVYAVGFEFSFLAFFIVLMIVNELYLNPRFDSFARRGHQIRYRLTSHLPTKVLWDGLVGTPPHKDRLANANITRFEYLGPDTQDRRLVEYMEPGALLEEHQFVDEIDAPHHIRFRWQAVDGNPDGNFSSGFKDVRITDHVGAYRTVDVVQAAQAHPWRAVVMNWIDDSFGRHNDEAVAELEARNPEDPFDPDALQSRPA